MFTVVASPNHVLPVETGAQILKDSVGGGAMEFRRQWSRPLKRWQLMVRGRADKVDPLGGLLDYAQGDVPFWFDGAAAAEVTEPGAEWVVAGEGIATQKFDGTCCMIRGGKLFKRYDVKNGRTGPHGFEPAQEADEVTGHQPGWLPVGEGPEDKWFREAWSNEIDRQDGTYELIGPKVNGNPEGTQNHVLVRHGLIELPLAPRSYDDLKEYFTAHNIEGIVWHHPDGRMVKIKKKDFGLKRT